MKIKKLIILGLVFFGMTSITACQKIDNGKPVETENNGGSVQPVENGEKGDSKAEVPNVAISGNIEVLEAKGDLEEAYVTFNKLEGAKKYNAYVKESGSDTYKAIDTQLIREYKDNIRVDVLGLKAGLYDVKIVPVDDSGEKALYQTVVSNLNVSAHERTGFGFVNGSSSGAYNDDGTLKANARVIYVSNLNKDTVETTAIEKKQTVTVKGLQNIITAMKAQKGIADPVCIRLLGNITDPQVLNKGDLYIDDVKNLTIEGIGNDATANGFGIVVKNSSCVEIRNVGFMNCNSNEGDDCGLQQKNDHIWVHNCDFFYGDAGSDADQAKGDGALDTKTSSYITHSYNHFYDNGKCNLQGMKDETTENYITYHHNWYDHSDSRHPRVRTCTVHVYNNYFDGNAKYGIASAIGASIFAENNYFRSTTNTIPFMSGLMAHDIKDDGTNVLSKEAGGVIKEYGNVFDGSNFRYTKYQDNNTSFDAYAASSRDEVVSSLVVPASKVVYNNFDTNPSIMYQYTVQTAEDAKKTVMAYAGRVQGGDFKWVFTDADDVSDKVNTELKAALVSYTSKLVSVQGIEAQSVTPSNPTDPSTPDTPVTPETPVDISGGYVKTFNNGVADDFFKITANLKSGVAEKVYENVKYTTAIKMESSTSIEFTLESDKTLVIITDAASKKIKVDDNNKVTDANGVLVIELKAGTHKVTKGDSINVYAFIIK
ncbi:MAG: hypothetical protein IKP12_06470 [Acholeplasmatales bacterium]|nr:hypothetical protein [Acholeplasmatales bacterium]